MILFLKNFLTHAIFLANFSIVTLHVSPCLIRIFWKLFDLPTIKSHSSSLVTLILSALHRIKSKWYVLDKSVIFRMLLTSLFLSNSPNLPPLWWWTVQPSRLNLKSVFNSVRNSPYVIEGFSWSFFVSTKYGYFKNSYATI